MAIHFNTALPFYATVPRNQTGNRTSLPGSDTFSRRPASNPLRFAGDATECPSPKNDQHESFLQEVEELTNAFSSYFIEEMKRKGKLLPVLLGGDAREATRVAMPYVAEILQENGIDVYQSNSDLPTPVLAYASKNFNAIVPDKDETLGALLLASANNQLTYSGYSFLMPDGSIISPDMDERIQTLRRNPKKQKLSQAERERLGGEKAGETTFELFNAFYAYKKHLIEDLDIDFDAIRKNAVSIYYDPMYATGRLYLPRLLKEQGIPARVIHGTGRRPLGYQGITEPVPSMLGELSLLVKADPSGLTVGLANDNDSDKFGVLDETGRYLPPNDVLLLLLYHLIKNKHQYGLVVRNQSTTSMLDALARKHGLPVIETPIGYEYVPEECVKHAKTPESSQVLMGAEASGGFSLGSNIPGRDGLVANLLIAELVAKERRPLSEILQDIKHSLKESYAFREAVINTSKSKEVSRYFRRLQTTGGELAGLKIDVKESVRRAKRIEERYDNRASGIKIWLRDGSWILLQANDKLSQHLYIEAVADTEKEAQVKNKKIFKALQNILGQDLQVELHNVATDKY